MAQRLNDTRRLISDRARQLRGTHCAASKKRLDAVQTDSAHRNTHVSSLRFSHLNLLDSKDFGASNRMEPYDSWHTTLHAFRNLESSIARSLGMAVSDTISNVIDAAGRSCVNSS